MTINKKGVGKVYCWGDCSSGKIGRTPALRNRSERGLKVYSLPVREVKNVWACGNHSFYKQVTYHDNPAGYICGWGLNLDGQLGLGHFENVTTPEWVEDLEGIDVVDISGGEYFSVFLASDGKVYGTGMNLYGQLGLGAQKRKVSTPELIELPEHIQKITCGDEFTYALTKQGEVYSWGSGLNYVLGNREEEDQLTPVKLASDFLGGEVALQVAAGTHHVMFLSTEPKNLLKEPVYKKKFLDRPGTSQIRI